MSTTIQLTADPGEIASRAVSREHRLRVSGSIKAILLLLLLILGGCKKRQLTTPTVQMDIEPQFWIRILLLNNASACILKTVSPFSVIDDQADPQIQNTEARFNQINVPISLELINGRITIAGQSFANDKVVISPDDPYIFNLDGSDYRGKLRLIITPDGNSFDVINLVPPEPYLAGVVGAEMPGYWEPEALKV